MFNWACVFCAVQVQTISFLSHLRSNGTNGPFLIIGPLSTLRNWVAEVRRFCPSMPVLEYHGKGAKARAQLRAQHMPLGKWPQEHTAASVQHLLTAGGSLDYVVVAGSPIMLNITT
eukprot:GHUV01025540.1.p2 GENE.GHUV01025540.1~~GHUV01025540.1.p2  ORF type:complete len:116 (-),score=31.20 GHUV01025540.1:605-952(-)